MTFPRTEKNLIDIKSMNLSDVEAFFIRVLVSPKDGPYGYTNNFGNVERKHLMR